MLYEVITNYDQGGNQKNLSPLGLFTEKGFYLFDRKGLYRARQKVEDPVADGAVFKQTRRGILGF